MEKADKLQKIQDVYARFAKVELDYLTSYDLHEVDELFSDLICGTTEEQTKLQEENDELKELLKTLLDYGNEGEDAIAMKNEIKEFME